jgi:hypothetical protein
VADEEKARELRVQAGMVRTMLAAVFREMVSEPSPINPGAILLGLTGLLPMMVLAMRDLQEADRVWAAFQAAMDEKYARGREAVAKLPKPEVEP